MSVIFENISVSFLVETKNPIGKQHDLVNKLKRSGFEENETSQPHTSSTNNVFLKNSLKQKACVSISQSSHLKGKVYINIFQEEVLENSVLLVLKSLIEVLKKELVVETTITLNDKFGIYCKYQEMLEKSYEFIRTENTPMLEYFSSKNQNLIIKCLQNNVILSLEKGGKLDDNFNDLCDELKTHDILKNLEYPYAYSVLVFPEDDSKDCISIMSKLQPTIFEQLLARIQYDLDEFCETTPLELDDLKELVEKHQIAKLIECDLEYFQPVAKFDLTSIWEKYCNDYNSSFWQDTDKYCLAMQKDLEKIAKEYEEREIDNL